MNNLVVRNEQKEVKLMEDLEKAKHILQQYKQQHILETLEKINENEKNKLVKQILECDFKKLNDIYNSRETKNTNNKINPMEFIDKSKLSKDEKDELDKLGEEIIKNNQYAVVTMAGGQGTRLGCDGPKGSFKLDIGEKGKYIFELLVETLKRAKARYGTEVYWYIMTSNQNNQQTIDFFEKNNFFGYNKEKVKFFIQGELPLLTLDGEIVLDEDYNIKTASNGNGSVYESLEKSGMLEDMKSKNIKWVYICGVDNIMAQMVDSTLLGLAIKKKVSGAAKAIRKAYPEEKVGIFCKSNGKPRVIEYIDMTEDMIYEKNDNGDLLYGLSYFVSNLLKIEAIEEIAKHELKYHCALKKNMYKFESFIFDGFEFLDDMAIMEVDRNKEFAPIKNATGVDSPATAIQIYERNLKNEI